MCNFFCFKQHNLFFFRKYGSVNFNTKFFIFIYFLFKCCKLIFIFKDSLKVLCVSKKESSFYFFAKPRLLYYEKYAHKSLTTYFCNAAPKNIKKIHKSINKSTKYSIILSVDDDKVRCHIYEI